MEEGMGPAMALLCRLSCLRDGRSPISVARVPLRPLLGRWRAMTFPESHFTPSHFPSQAELYVELPPPVFPEAFHDDRRPRGSLRDAFTARRATTSEEEEEEEKDALEMAMAESCCWRRSI